MLASITSMLAELLALLPFMDPARAQIVINSFLPMLNYCHVKRIISKALQIGALKCKMVSRIEIWILKYTICKI